MEFRNMNNIIDEAYEAFKASYDAYEYDISVCKGYVADYVAGALNAKRGLIDILKNHPNYDADNYRIVLDTCVTRHCDSKKAREALTNLSYALRTANDFQNNSWIAKPLKIPMVNEIMWLGGLLDKAKAEEYFLQDTVSEECVEWVRSRNCFEGAHIHKGAKTTKALMKLLRQYGVQERRYCDLREFEEKFASGTITSDEYELLRAERWHTEVLRCYANYADAMNPLEIKNKTIISVNPVDFLYMSNGNSWESCHDMINHSGCYQAGCQSYALDETTMIYFTLPCDTEPEHITEAKKITRQLLFWNGQLLFFSRMYPQNLDGDSVIYSETRAIIEDAMAKALKLPNAWKLISKEGADDCTFISHGRHYPDYKYSCYHFKVFTPSAMIDDENFINTTFEIGSDNGICTSCGGRLDDDERAFCIECEKQYVAYCSDCGEGISNWCDVYETVDGRDICRDCVEDHYYYCERCGSYEREDNAIYVHRATSFGYREDYYCSDCASLVAAQCEHCDEYWLASDVITTRDGYILCRDCYEGEAVRCSGCGDVYYLEENCPWRDDAGAHMCDDCYEAWLEEHKNEEEE